LGRGAAKKHLTAEVGMFVREGKIAVLPETVPVEITPEYIVLAHTAAGEMTDGPRIRQPADFVLLCTGFVADMQLFAAAGVALEGPRQVPRFDPETLQTNVPGLYVAGTAAGGTQHKFQLFIETCHVHVDRLVTVLSGRPPQRPFAPPEAAIEVASENAEM
jgi:thioredoxin reductase (NADPH)